MVKVFLNGPFRTAIAPALPRPELAEVLSGRGIALTDDPGRADFEVNGRNDKVWSLPPERVLLITGEPPQPQNIECAYFLTGFGAVLTPANRKVYARDCMAYYAAPSPLFPRRKKIKKIDKIVQLATFRNVGGNTPDGRFLVGSLNGREAFCLRVLCHLRSLTGVQMKTACPDHVDLYGKGYPAGLSVKENSRRDGDWFRRKLGILTRYGFNLCWENMEIPCYASEKLWDAIRAGVLPMYWGAPEIHARLPRDSILDCRAYDRDGSFDTGQMFYDAMHMDEAEYARRINLLYDWYESLDRNGLHKSLIVAAHLLADEILALAAADRAAA